MTARGFVPINSPAHTNSNVPAENAESELNRKRSLFLDFCVDFLSSTGSQQDRDAEDSKLFELFRNANVPSVEVINDLPGVLANPAAAAAAAQTLNLEHISTAHADPAAAGRPLHHRVVSTGLAMPATTRGAAAAAGDDDDTSSVRTLPMPSRKRRRSEEEDEACSSPNDLVEVPAAQTAAANFSRLNCLLAGLACGLREARHPPLGHDPVGTDNVLHIPAVGPHIDLADGGGHTDIGPVPAQQAPATALACGLRESRHPPLGHDPVGTNKVLHVPAVRPHIDLANRCGHTDIGPVPAQQVTACLGLCSSHCK